MTTEGGQLVLVRHGATEWSMAHRHTGRTDLPLVPEGRLEAEAAGQRLTQWQFDEVYSSPLIRARTTAELAGFPEAVLDDDLMEWDYGQHEGRTTAEVLVDQPGFVKWGQRPPGGESVDEVGARIDRFIATLTGGDSSANLDRDVVVFAHGHSLAVLVARWLGLGAEHGVRFPLRTATLTVLGVRRGIPVVQSLNC